MMPEEPTRTEEDDPFAGIGKGEGSYPPPRKMSAGDIARKIVAMVICLLGAAVILGGYILTMYTRNKDLLHLGWLLGLCIFGFAAAVYDGMIF